MGYKELKDKKLKAIILFGAIAFFFAGFGFLVSVDKTTYYSIGDDNRIHKVATAYDKLFEGSSQKNRDVSMVRVENYLYKGSKWVLEVNDTRFMTSSAKKQQVRVTPYKVGGTLKHHYFIDGNITDIANHPVDEYVMAYNLTDYLFRWEVRDLEYNGLTDYTATSPLKLPNNIVITFEPGYNYAHMYKSGVFKVQYPITSDEQRFDVRLFDPTLAWDATVGLNAFFVFNDTSDETGNYTWNQTGGGFSSTNCILGSCYHKNSSDFMNVDDSLVVGKPNITIAMWIRHNSNVNDHFRVLSTKGSWHQNGYNLNIRSSSGALTARGDGSSEIYGTYHNSWYSSASAPHGYNNWTFIAATTEDTGANADWKIYGCNGSILASGTIGDVTANKQLHLGRFAGGDKSFVGYFDQMAVWGKLLNGTQISDICNNYASVTYADILASVPCTPLLINITNTSTVIQVCNASSLAVWQNQTIEYDNNSCGGQNTTYLINYTKACVCNASWSNSTTGSVLYQACNVSNLRVLNLTINWTDSNTCNSSYLQYILNETSCTYNASITGFSVALVLNLTFDNESEPWRDYSALAHPFDSHSVTWANRTYCKWYGCANMSLLTSDYLNSTVKFNLNNGITASWWHKTNSHPTGGNSMGYWEIGDGSNSKRVQEGDYGKNVELSCADGFLDRNEGAGDGSVAGTWEHHVVMYNGTHLIIWKNGVVTSNTSDNYGVLNSTKGDIIEIGKAIFNVIDLEGWMDEFLLWNRSNFATSEVKELYDSRKESTPPDIDLWTSNITYALPYNWSEQYNYLDDTGTMEVNLTFKNQGAVTNSNSSVWNFSLNGAQVCNGAVQLDAGVSKTIVCNWTIAWGFHTGTVQIDTTGTNAEGSDGENNNQQTIFIPFENRPWMHFNLTDWYDTYIPYCLNSANNISYDACVMALAHTAEDFNDGWTGNDVDPRGKKGRELAMACLRNDYNTSATQCVRVRNHLNGWGNRTVTTYSSTQEIHEVSNLGFMFDVMFPNMTKVEYVLWSKQYHDICQEVSKTSGVTPWLDNDDRIAGDNGQGFGTGMGTLCYAMIGAYKNNPTMMLEPDTGYDRPNLVDEWMDRELRYIRSYKNDSWAQYQEGWLYKTYSQYHLAENWYFEKRFNLNNLSLYQNALCSMAREELTSALDHTYDGDTLRGDEAYNFRWISRGDTNSYQNVADGNYIDWELPTILGLLCDDNDTKSAILHLRNLADQLGEDVYTDYTAIYAYKDLADQVTKKDPSDVMPNAIIDRRNNIFTLRTDYSYVNDTVLMVDGGEETGGGHSQAQSYFLYALGEPFIDYEQVPCNDDVRHDTWKNGISLQNTSQTEQCTNGQYLDTLGEYAYNQYYGGANTVYFSTNYSDYRTYPQKYGGDVEDYMGTDSAEFGAVFVERPYFNASSVREYFIKFGPLVAKRTVVSDNLQGAGVYHNFINLENESDITIVGTNFTFNISTKNLKTGLIYDNSSSMVLGGGITGLQACKEKTSCTAANHITSKYRRMYYYTPYNDTDMIHYHTWFYDGGEVSVSQISGNDDGLLQSGRYTLFDTDNDGDVNYSTYDATGWAMGYDADEFWAANTTYMEHGDNNILDAQYPISSHFKRGTGSINFTTNTFWRDNYIDVAHKVNVTIDAQDLTNDANYTVVDSDGSSVSIASTSGTKITFEIETDQNSETYTITANDTTAAASDCDCPGPTGDYTIGENCTISAACQTSGDMTFTGAYHIIIDSVRVNVSSIIKYVGAFITGNNTWDIGGS